MRKMQGIGVALGMAAIAGLVIWCLWPVDPTGVPAEETDDVGSSWRGIPSSVDSVATGGRGNMATADATDDPLAAGEENETAGEPQTEEEKAEAAEEAAVEAFDALTDKWMEPATAKVDLKAIAAFAETFRKVPQARRDECIHRALNLIPDENVMLLAGVLMDKSMPKEIVETVFNDVLNRDEDVKKPILQEIFKDKTHSCWADTAWILDVTGELPKGTVPDEQ